ncbi:putative gustatory receptor 77a [Drosophila montana]|uniref:putative gustatory receptor 77a n=1 Tax=Drosophila montana TaxID=40370 RepID=UPI00313F3C00
MLRLHSAHLLLQHLLTSGTLRALHLLSQLLGLMAATRPPSMTDGLERLQCSSYWRLYGHLVLLFVLCYSPYAFYIVYTRMDFLRQNRLLLIVGCHRYALLLCAALVTLYSHTTRQLRIIAWVNKLIWCRHQLLGLLHTTRLQESARVLHTRDHLTVYALALSIVCSCSYTMFILQNDPMAHRSPMYFCSVLFFYGCQLSLQVCLSVYLLGLLMISHLTHHSNLLLAQILDDAVNIQYALLARCLPSRRRLHEAQQHWLALELWRLWRLHGQLMQLSRRLCSLHSIQLLAFVVFASTELVMHLFFSYFVTFSRWWLRKFGKPAPWNPQGSIFTVSLFVQLTLVVVQTHRLQQVFKTTRRTLREGALALPADCSKALRQTLHLYGLHLQLNERIFNLTACGLFELNNGLLFGIVQTIIIYTTILIQFDKIMNR